MTNKKKKTIKTILRTSLLVLAALIVGFNVYAINAAHLAGNAVPMPFGVGMAVVLSGSMEPEFSAGDLLIVAEQDSYEVRDIIVFQDGRMSVTHRIVAMDEEQVITKGDANNVEDAPISYDQIKGEVVLKIPYVGHIVNVIKTPIGTIVIFGLAILLVELSFRKQKTSDQKELDQIKAEIEKLKQEQASET